MRTEAAVYLFVFVFVGVVGAVYWFTSYEDSGTVMLLAMALLGLFAGGYLWRASRRMTRRPQDREDATVPEGVGPVAFVPVESFWPAAVAASAAVLASGLVFGTWLLLVGGGCFVVAVTGFVLESRRAIGDEGGE